MQRENFPCAYAAMFGIPNGGLCRHRMDGNSWCCVNVIEFGHWRGIVSVVLVRLPQVSTTLSGVQRAKADKIRAVI